MIPWAGNWPTNVWIGTTVENQEKANQRIPILLEYPALVRFVSCEPLLGKVDLNRWLNYHHKKQPSIRIDWVIAGGESGYNARPTHPRGRGISETNASAVSTIPFQAMGLLETVREWDEIGGTDHFASRPQIQNLLLSFGKGKRLQAEIWMVEYGMKFRGFKIKY